MSDKLDATISISADTSGVEAGIDKTKRSLKNLGASAQGMAGELARAGREGGAGLDAIGKGGDRAAKQVEQAERSMRNSIQRQIAQMQAGSKTSREYWESLANQRGVNTAGLRSMLDQLEAVQRAQKKATESADGWGASLRGAGAAAAGLLGALSLSEFVGKLVSVQREFDVLNASLVTVTGSAQAAATEFSWIKDFAKETPFGLKQATEAFVKMKSLGLDPTKASLTSFGNTASAMGKSLDQMIEAVADASTSEFERLKEFGIKASQSGETVAMTFQGVTKNIGNNAQEIVAYLESIGNHEFAGAMAERAKTLDGAIAELGDTWDEVFRTINENNTGSFIHDSVKLATGAIEDLNTIMRSLNEATSEGAQATGAFKTMQEGLAIVFETVAVVGLTVKDTLVGVGREIGAIAAQAAALARLDFKGFAAIGDMAKEDAQKARAEWEQAVDAILTARQRVATGPALTNPKDEGANKKTVVDLNSVATAALNATKSFQSKAEKMAEVREQGDKLRGALRQLEQAGQGASKEAAQLRERLKGVDERLASMAKSGGDGAKGIKATDNSIKSFIKSLEAKTAAQRLEIAQGEKLTESQRARIQLEALLADTKNKASKSQVANAQALLAESEANEAWLKNASDVEKALADMQKARDQSLRSVQDSAKKLVEEAEAAAYAETHNVSLAEAVERLALARAENAYQQAIERQEAPATLDYLRQEIEARKELVAATAQKGVKEANKKAAEQAAKDWERTSKTIGDTLADYIMGGGKNAAQYLKRLFSTLVLQPVVQTVVGGAMGSLGLGGPTKGGAGGSLNALSAGKGLWDAWSGSTGGMLASGVSALGSLTGSVFLGELGSAIAAGVELGISGAAALTGSASATTTAGMWLGAAAPWVAGIGALLSIVPSFLNGGTPHVGAAALYSGGRLSDYGADYTSHTAVTRSYEEAMQKPVSAIVTSIGGALDAIAKTFGKQSGYSVSAGFSADNDDPAAALLSIIDPAGNSPVYWTAGRFGALDTRRKSKFSSDTKEAFDQYLQSITAEVIPVFKGIVPGWADNLLTQLSDSLGVTQAIESGDPYAWQQMTASGQEAFQALQNTLAQIAMIKQAFAALGDTMTVLADLSDEAQTSLLQKFGGIEALGKSAESFYQNFFTADEQRSKLQAKLSEAFSAVDLTLPDIDASNAREQYRALAEAQDLATESGRAAWAVIMQLGEAFASITPSIEDAAAAMAAEAERAAQAMQDEAAAMAAEAERAAQAMQDAAAAMAAMRQQANGIVDAQAQSLQSLIDGLNRQEQQVSGGYLGDLLLSGSEFTQFAGFADQLDGATQALEQLQALGLGDELKGYADQIGAIVLQTKEALAGALSAQRLMAGDAAGAIAAAISASMPQYSDFTTDGNFNAGAFNAALWTEKAKAASGLIYGASANALSVPGAGGVLGTLMGDITTYGREVVLRDLRASGAEYLGPLISGMFTGVYDVLAAKAETAMISGPGLASVMAARRQFGGVQAEFDAFAKSFEAVQGSLKSGRISAEEAEKAIGYLTASFGDLTPLLSDAAAQAARVASAALDLSAAGMASVDYYFGSLTDIVQGFSEAAAKANAPLAEATRAIGLLDSMTAAFGQSASAALVGSRAAVDGYLKAAQAAREQGDWNASWTYSSQAAQAQLSLDGLAAVDSRVSKAQMIADAAAMASGIMTTASAAKAAEELAGKLVLGEGQSMRDLSLLVNGVSKYDNQAFYEAFARISDALGSGSISNEQYKTLFDYALGTYQGVSDEAKATASAFERLRDSMKSFADSLLIGDKTTLSPEATLTEMQRQYAEAFKAAADGDTDAISEYQSLANGLLDKLLYSTQAEYNVAFGRTYGDARTLEAQGVNMLAQQQNNSVVTELKSLNASLTKRVGDLEKNLTAALAQIAKNTADTVKGVRKQTEVMEEGSA